MPPTGLVSGTSRSFADTGPLGSFEVFSASSPYADISATGAAEPPPGASATTSRLTTPMAGVSAAHTTASASTCWVAVTKRAWKGVGPEGMRGYSMCEGKVHTSSNFHTRHRGADSVSE